MSPSNQERLFQKSYAMELVNIARADGMTARYLLEGLRSGKIRNENFFFQAQQCIEKAIKAVLVQVEQPVPLVHDLGILLAKVPRQFEPPFGYEIARLSDFAAVRRYEESVLQWGEQEADEAMTLVEQALRWAEAIITGPESP